MTMLDERDMRELRSIIPDFILTRKRARKLNNQKNIAKSLFQHFQINVDNERNFILNVKESSIDKKEKSIGKGENESKISKIIENNDKNSIKKQSIVHSASVKKSDLKNSTLASPEKLDFDPLNIVTSTAKKQNPTKRRLTHELSKNLDTLSSIQNSVNNESNLSCGKLDSKLPQNKLASTNQFKKPAKIQKLEEIDQKLEAAQKRKAALFAEKAKIAKDKNEKRLKLATQNRELKNAKPPLIPAQPPLLNSNRPNVAPSASTSTALPKPQHHRQQAPPPGAKTFIGNTLEKMKNIFTVASPLAHASQSSNEKNQEKREKLKKQRLAKNLADIRKNFDLNESKIERLKDFERPAWAQKENLQSYASKMALKTPEEIKKMVESVTVSTTIEDIIAHMEKLDPDQRRIERFEETRLI